MNTQPPSNGVCIQLRVIVSSHPGFRLTQLEHRRDSTHPNAEAPGIAPLRAGAPPLDAAPRAADLLVRLPGRAGDL
eukprot:scaffold107507_cov69-Phaeocystis_antarctica.AAC.3